MKKTINSGKGKPGPLNGVRVLDLTTAIGQPCGRLLGDLGADVVLVEPEHGTPSRHIGPFSSDPPSIEEGLYYLNFNTNKRSIIIDLESKDGRNRLCQLATKANILLESYPPGHLDALGIGYQELSKKNPSLIFTSITPFGQTGPYRKFKGNDFTLGAIGGYTFTEGDPDGVPITPPHYQSYQLGGVHAAFGTLLALRHFEKTGTAQQVDVAIHEVISNCQMHIRDYVAQFDIGSRWGGLPGPKGGLYPANNYQCKDGWIVLAMTSEQAWTRFAEWSQDSFLTDRRFLSHHNRTKELTKIDRHISAFIGRWDAEQFVEAATSRRLNAAVMHDPISFLDHPHVKSLNLFAQVEHPILGTYRTLGPPALYSRSPWKIRRPAPLLGEHTSEVLDEWSSIPPVKSNVTKDSSMDALPLEHVNVTAFSRGWAAPYGTRYLGDFGAQVVKIESTKFSDGRTIDPRQDYPMWWELNSQFAEMNRNKLSVTLDLHTEGGQNIFRKLTEISDVVVENNKPGAMEKFGLSYEDLQKINPGIIMVRAPAYGTSGPLRDRPAVGQILNGFTGMGYLWGLPNSPLSHRSKLAYPDFVISAHLALAVMAALRHRDHTGEGQQVEIPQFQTTATMINTAFLEHYLIESLPSPMGNRSSNEAPQGIYRCEGEDRWCAISCTSNSEWQALCSLMGNANLANDADLATPGQRMSRHDELDDHIQAWTNQKSPHQVMLLCQQAGIHAGVVSNGEDLYRDPQLRSRGNIMLIPHQVPGPLEHPGMTVRLTKTPGRVRYPSPRLGEHNESILRDLLHIGDDEKQRLDETGALN